MCDVICIIVIPKNTITDRNNIAENVLITFTNNFVLQIYTSSG